MCQNLKLTYDVFLSGLDVNLIVLTQEIAENSSWYSWFNEAETTNTMQKGYFPNTPQKQLIYFRDHIENSETKIQLGILHKLDNVLIGVISLNNIDYLNKKCEVAGLIGNRRYKAIKYFLEANKLIFKHAVNTLGLHRIYGGSLSKEVSIYYERMLEFQQEGVHRQEVFKNGEFNDVYYFARIFDGPL